MYKSVRSNSLLGGGARLFFAVVPAALLAALVLAGCDNPTNANEYTLTVSIDPDTGGNVLVLYGSSNKECNNGDKVKVTAGDSVSLEAIAMSKHKFFYWSGQILDSVNNPVKFAVKGNWKVTAHFLPE